MSQVAKPAVAPSVSRPAVSSVLSGAEAAVKGGNLKEAIQLYSQFLLDPQADETVLREKEAILMQVAKLFTERQ